MIDRWLEKDVTLKLLALAVAVVLWLRVASVQSPVVSVTLSGVPVQTVALAADLAIAEVRPDRVEVTMRAPRSTLNRLGPDDLRAEVDLKGAGAGRLSLPVSVKAPRGVQVLETRPAHVQVSVDYLSERQVPVQVVAIGVVGEDYRVESPLPSPTEVLASGPRGQVARVRWAAGEVDVTGATADVLSTVALRPVDNTGKEVPGITLRPQEVQVKFTLVKLPPAKEVTVQATLRGEPPLGFRLEEARVSPPVVRIRGPEDRLNAITSVGTKPIDLQDLRADGEKEVGLALPPGVVMADPPTVLVYLRVAEDIGETEVSN
ncbi:MAG TPA: hypothetical protein GX513_04115, partial [Firmicutes bacterium]|nr:hypothetical protein [Bacillota bacterium]